MSIFKKIEVLSAFEKPRFEYYHLKNDDDLKSYNEIKYEYKNQQYKINSFDISRSDYYLQTGDHYRDMKRKELNFFTREREIIQ